MSITGNNNVLLGAGATLPALAGNHQFVAGSPHSTAYLAYSGSRAATASGVVAAPSGFTIGGRTALNVGGTVGTATDALYSAGAGAPGAGAGAGPYSGWNRKAMCLTGSTAMVLAPAKVGTVATTVSPAKRASAAKPAAWS